MFLSAILLPLVAGVPLPGERFYLLTGIDNRLYPGATRPVAPQPGPGFPGAFNDGDRLAGTSDVGPQVVFQGIGTPIIEANAFGSFSMLYRRGSAPVGGGNQVPFMGIEFLGGPRLDLDGDPNMPRSLVPVETSPGVFADAVELPGDPSFIELAIDVNAGGVSLLSVDALATNESGPFQAPETGVVLITLAGTSETGVPGKAINPTIDNRMGQVTAFGGASGGLTGVYSITDLGYEVWEDSIDPGSSTASVLGTMQFLGVLDGWLIERGPLGWPTLTGENLGGTRWPTIDTASVGASAISAVTGGPVTITDGFGGDTFSAPGGGGLPLLDFGGDLGAYLDNVVIPALPSDASQFVYLSSAGFGVNNSFDPVFQDTIGYDAVLIAYAVNSCAGAIVADSNCDGSVNAGDIDAFVTAVIDEAAYRATYPCDYVCTNDTNGDGAVNAGDIDGFVMRVVGGG